MLLLNLLKHFLFTWLEQVIRS